MFCNVYKYKLIEPREKQSEREGGEEVPEAIIIIELSFSSKKRFLRD